MSQNHRYFLEPYKGSASRHSCPNPNCGQKGKFSFYIDRETNEPLGDHVGRCSRSDSCGYHFTPKMFFEANPEAKPSDFSKWNDVPAPPSRPVSYIDNSVFKKTLGLNYRNTFITFLIALFGKERTEMLINKYNIGTAETGEVIFHQVDLQGNVRSGKVMKYNIIENKETVIGRDCKRDKKYINWTHTKLKLDNFNLKQCLFGEHLLTDNRPVGIVESAKSAIIASVYYPQLVWVSCEGKEGLNLDKLKVLKGKDVILFPDLSKITEKKELTAFELWTQKAKEMTFCKSVVVDDLLEEIATIEQRKEGFDLADFLLREPAPEGSSISIEITPAEPEPAEPDEAIKNFTPILGKSTKVVISDDEFKRYCETLDFWNKRLHLFDNDSFMIVDKVAIPDIRSVIIKHLNAIHNNNNSVASLQFLEKVKQLITI